MEVVWRLVTYGDVEGRGPATALSVDPFVFVFDVDRGRIFARFHDAAEEDRDVFYFAFREDGFVLFSRFVNTRVHMKCKQYISSICLNPMLIHLASLKDLHPHFHLSSQPLPNPLHMPTHLAPKNISKEEKPLTLRR